MYYLHISSAQFVACDKDGLFYIDLLTHRDLMVTYGKDKLNISFPQDT